MHLNIPSESVCARDRQRQAARAFDETVHAQMSRPYSGLSPIALALAHADWALHLMVSPGRQALLAQRALELSLQAWRNTFDDKSDTAPAEKDARFADPGWNQWPFNAFKESYKAVDAWWRDLAQQDGGVSRHHQHMVNFFTAQALDALAPSNWALTNPEVLRAAKASSGQSLIKGMQFFLEDLQEQFNTHADSGAQTLKPLQYAVGKDVAVTPGKVVFRNHLIELIQYSPSTTEVQPEPVLIVPSCIMKYYILDLSPQNSMVKYLVNQGHTVFIISWRNPDASDRDLKMQDYLSTGVLAAMAAAKSRSGAKRLHTMGYCLGGTLLTIAAAALGRLARSKKPRTDKEQALIAADLPELASVILLAAQTDFTEPGELGVFIDEEQLTTLRQNMNKKGYLSGKQMGGSFVYLAARNMIWARNTRRYLLGEDDASFDLMSWNADTTRLPARMHSEYLDALFLNNALAAGQYRFAGSTVALMDISAPMMVVATTRDHVSPWKSVYKIHLQTDTHVTFVLAEGGHNAGIVSEPGHPRRSYQIASIENNNGWIDPDDWKAQAPVIQGSWWEAMHTWLTERSGKPIAPPTMAAEHVLGDAPGQYVMTRYAD